MKIYAIKDSRHKKRPAQSWLLYDEDNGSFSIRISETADKEDLPFMLTCLFEKGLLEVSGSWADSFVRSRIVPSERQNLGAILKANGLDVYDEYDMLMLNMGRCCMDDYYLEETDGIEEQRSYGYMIEAARSSQGMTQSRLAERSGLKQSNISRIESGEDMPTLETLHAVAKGLGKKLEIRFV